MTSNKHRHILIVDDSVFVCERLAAALAEAGYAVTTACDLGALQAEAPSSYDLVILDVVLKEAFGDEVGAVLKAVRGFDCPLILVSSLPDVELARRAAEAELDGHMSKRAGTPAIVNYARSLIGDPSGDEAPQGQAAPEPSDAFSRVARQRARRVADLASSGARQGAAIIAEMHALTGEAFLAGAVAVAEAANECLRAAEAARDDRSGAQLDAAVEGLVAAVEAATPATMRGPATLTATGRRLLILDDSDFYRTTLLALLDDAGHMIAEARTLSEARQRLGMARYDLVILDVQLEDGTGPSLIPQIRASMPAARLLVLTGGEATPEMHRADAVLSKSLGPEQLLCEIDRLLT